MKKISLLILTLIFSYSTYAQSIQPTASPYFNIKHQYRFLDYVLSSGRLKVNHLLSQPYSAEEIRANLNTNSYKGFNKHWIEILDENLGKYVVDDSSNKENDYWNVGITGGINFNGLKGKGASRNRFGYFALYSLPYLVLFTSGAFDQNLKDDPCFYGSPNKFSLIGRVEDAYAIFKYKFLEVFVGRLNRNLGMLNEPSLVFSDNSYSFDHFGFDIKNKLFKYSFYFTRLNDVYGYDIQEEDKVYEWKQRYFYLHRLEISPLKNLEIAFTEMALNSGKSQGYLPYYLNPVNLFRSAERNQRSFGKDNSSNIFYSLETYWKPLHNLTLYSQFLLDDIDFGKELRRTYPDRLGYSAKLILTDFLVEGSQIYSAYNRLDSWTYISFRSWENYTYNGKSIGYPNNNVENYRIGLDYFGKPPFIFSAFVKYEKLGLQDWDATFNHTIKEFPRGIVQDLYNFNFTVDYIPSANFSASLILDWRTYENMDHIFGKKEKKFMVSLSLSANFDYRNYKKFSLRSFLP